MRLKRSRKSIIATIFLLFVAIFPLTGCFGESQEVRAKQEVEEKNDQAEQDIKQRIKDSITTEVLKYISGDVIVSVQTSDDSTEAAVYVRTILPQAIPLVAENICASSVNVIEEKDITDYIISVDYYEESNQNGTDGNSLVHWHTRDGNKGTFVNAKNDITKEYTIEELYKYYDNFGKESSVEDKEMTLKFSFGEITGIYSGDVNAAGRPDGYGTFTPQAPEGSGWTYEGDWKNGHFDGTGTCTWDSGQVYSGGFSNDSESGSGKFAWSDGSYFEGTFTSAENPDGNRNATGVYYDSDGTSLDAKMVNGKITLVGTPEEIEKFKSASEQKNTESTANSSMNESSEKENILVSEDRTVYVTKTGKKYHYDSNCNGGTYMQSTLSDAEAKGLTPCKKCAEG